MHDVAGFIDDAAAQIGEPPKLCLRVIHIAQEHGHVVVGIWSRIAAGARAIQHYPL